MKLILAWGLVLLLSACGKSGDSGDGQGATSMSTFRDQYQFSSGGCDTGFHAFVSDNYAEFHRDYCYTLRDDSKNNYCHQAERYELFDQKCGEYSLAR